MEAISSKYTEADTRDLINLYTNIIALGLSLPTSLQSIQKSLQRTELFVQQQGEPNWQSKILLLKSNLQRNRGQFDEALESLQQAWALRRNVYPVYTQDTYMKNFIKLLIYLKQFDQAELYFIKWINLTDEQPGRRTKRLSLRRIQYARATGNKAEALNMARIFTHHFSDIFDAHQLIETYIANGFTDLCITLLARFVLKDRNSESLYKQLYLQTLIGDFRYATVRKLLNLSPIDMRYEKLPDNEEIDTQLLNANSAMIMKNLAKAKRSYSKATAISQEIDQLIQGTKNQSEINERIEKMLYTYSRINQLNCTINH